MKILSSDHAQIVAGIWKELPQSEKVAMYGAISKVLKARHPGTEELPFSQVVAQAWCIGFHSCMVMMETGALVSFKAGKVGTS